MNHKITTLPETRLIGIRHNISLSENTTRQLAQAFRPRIPEIKNKAQQNVFVIQDYGTAMSVGEFNPQTRFDRWMAMAVSTVDEVPEGMEIFVLPAGKYAVFHHIGPVAEAIKTARTIFSEWLSQSGEQLDNRPHFEILALDYHPTKPDAEEDFYIPLK